MATVTAVGHIARALSDYRTPRVRAVAHGRIRTLPQISAGKRRILPHRGGAPPVPFLFAPPALRTLGPRQREAGVGVVRGLQHFWPHRTVWGPVEESGRGLASAWHVPQERIRREEGGGAWGVSVALRRGPAQGAGNPVPNLFRGGSTSLWETSQRLPKKKARELSRTIPEIVVCRALRVRWSFSQRCHSRCRGDPSARGIPQPIRNPKFPT